MQNCVVKGYFRFCCCDFSEFEFIIIHWCFLLFSKIFHFVMVCFRCTGTLDILAHSQFCLLFFLLPSLSVVRSSFPSMCSWFYCCHFLPLVFGIIVFFRFCFFTKNWCYFSDSQSASRVFARSAEKRFFLLIEKEAGLESICCKHTLQRLRTNARLKIYMLQTQAFVWKKIRYSKQNEPKILNEKHESWVEKARECQLLNDSLSLVYTRKIPQ